MGRKRGFLTGHAKSSAAVISLGIHAVLIVVALSFVAVRVYVNDDQTFVAQKVNRPRMKLKKLTVPVKIQKKRAQKPKLRKTIVVKKEVKSVDIKMPEMSGIKGGQGYLNGGDGLGGLGFDFDINFFGILGGGKHIVFVIDYSQSMKGEKDAIMRREASRVIRELPKGVKFSAIFFAGPAWPADSGLEKYLDGWVKSGKNAHSFRPKDWNKMPKVRYKTVSGGTCSSMITHIETTPLVFGTVYDCPIYMALNMNPIPDTIFFMTDGACADERGIVSLRRMVGQLKASGKKVPVMHTVGFGISNNRQLKEMAELMGGECNFLTAGEYIKKYGPDKSKRGQLKAKVNVKNQIKSVPASEYPIEFSL